jgi:hypothetical protein
MSEYRGSDQMEPPEGWMAAMTPEGRGVAETVVARQRHSLAGLVSAWVASVRGIMEDRGEDYYEDYFGYLCWREDIDELLAALPEADASIVLKAVELADAQFRAHTVDDGGEAMSRKSFTIRKDLWYWRRVPIRGPIARSLGTEET